MDKKILTTEQMWENARTTFATFMQVVAAVLASDFDLNDGEHCADICASLADSLPSLPSETALLLAVGRSTEATEMVREALNELRRVDEPLFAPCPSKAEYTRLKGQFTAVTVARAEADRGGPTDLRRAAYQLRHKLLGIPADASDRLVPDVPVRAGIGGGGYADNLKIKIPLE